MSTYLPAGFPAPDRETLARLRETIMRETRTAHPPEWAELAVLVSADEAGCDLAGLDPREIWAMPVVARSPVFEALGRLLAELHEG